MLIPLLFNDGRPVPESLITDTLIELEQKFGAVSSETQTIRGRWHHEGLVYRDDLTRVFMEVPDEPEARQFFAEYKGAPQGPLPTTRYLDDNLPRRGSLNKERVRFNSSVSRTNAELVSRIINLLP
jgi:hypothetical protein